MTYIAIIKDEKKDRLLALMSKEDQTLVGFNTLDEARRYFSPRLTNGSSGVINMIEFNFKVVSIDESELFTYFERQPDVVSVSGMSGRYLTAVVTKRVEELVNAAIPI